MTTQKAEGHPELPVGTGEGQYPAQIGETPPGTPETPPAGAGETFVGTYRTKEDAEQGLREKDQTISRLQTDVHGMKGQLESMQRLVDTYVTRPTGTHPGHVPPAMPSYQPGYSPPPETPGRPAADLPELKLRDPLEDNEGFKEDLQKFLTNAISVAGQAGAKQVVDYIHQTSEERSRGEALWEYFKAVNADLAPHADLVAMHWQRLYNSQIPQNVPGMVQHLAQETRNTLARARGEQPPTSPGGTPPPAPGRADAVVGGTPPPTPPAPAPAARPTSMMTELRNIQSKDMKEFF